MDSAAACSAERAQWPNDDSGSSWIVVVRDNSCVGFEPARLEIWWPSTVTTTPATVSITSTRRLRSSHILLPFRYGTHSCCALWWWCGGARSKHPLHLRWVDEPIGRTRVLERDQSPPSR